ncbi:MAG: glycosyltransferase family 4 protein [Croceibacterium sp.]
MRILFLVSSMEGGGAERVAALLCNRWVEIGHEVILMPTFSGRNGNAYPLAPQVNLRYLTDLTTTPIMQTSFGRLFALRRAIATIAPDIVLSFLTNVNVAAILAADKTPVVVSERVYPPLMKLSRFWEWMRLATYRNADRVVMQTQEGIQWLERAIPGAHGAIIGNPLVMPLPEGEPIVEPALYADGSRKILLGVGRLSQQKNFALLISAFARIAPKFPSWQLVLVGEGEDRGELEALVEQLGLVNSVKLVGRVGNMSDWYRSAEAFALTSRVEGLPNALLEALAFAVPSLSLDCSSGPADLMAGADNCILLPADANVDQLAEGLRDLLSRDWKRTAETGAGTRAKYDISKIAADWLNLFEQVLAATPRKLPS